MAVIKDDIAVPFECAECSTLLDVSMSAWVSMAPAVGAHSDEQVRELVENHLRLYHSADHVGGP